jgi:hypothetical protein
MQDHASYQALGVFYGKEGSDWSESFGGMGPRPQAVVTKEMAVALATRYGFQVQNDTLPAGEHHYAILFRKV